MVPDRGDVGKNVNGGGVQGSTGGRGRCLGNWTSMWASGEGDGGGEDGRDLDTFRRPAVVTSPTHALHGTAVSTSPTKARITYASHSTTVGSCSCCLCPKRKIHISFSMHGRLQVISAESVLAPLISTKFYFEWLCTHAHCTHIFSFFEPISFWTFRTLTDVTGTTPIS